jgi:virginiamycin B lyase
MNPSGPITVGRDGALWLIASLARNDTLGSLWRVTTSGGATTELPSGIWPFGACTTGSDGAVWFFTLGNGIGRITSSGQLRFFPVPSTAYIVAMTVGPDGAVWFTDTGTHALGRITPAGAVSEYPTTLLPYLSGGIVTGSDGALWFTSYSIMPNPPYSTNDLIGRYTPATGFQSFPVTPGSAPNAIAAGPDGALWYTEGANHIGRITTAGKLAEYPLPLGIPYSLGITNGPGKALWFVAATSAAAVGEITMAGAVSLTPVPSQYSVDGGITATPDGSLWLTSAAGVVHFTP